jgi:hypothetical protein
MSKERLNQKEKGPSGPCYYLRIDKKHIIHCTTISVQNHLKAGHNSNLIGSGKSIPQSGWAKNKKSYDCDRISSARPSN